MFWRALARLRTGSRNLWQPRGLRFLAASLCPIGRTLAASPFALPLRVSSALRVLGALRGLRGEPRTLRWLSRMPEGLNHGGGTEVSGTLERLFPGSRLPCPGSNGCRRLPDATVFLVASFVSRTPGHVLRAFARHRQPNLPLIPPRASFRHVCSRSRRSPQDRREASSFAAQSPLPRPLRAVLSVTYPLSIDSR